MGFLNSHPGSWSIGGYQLPDYGLTEQISNIFGGGRTAQGGSNLSAAAPLLPQSGLPTTLVPNNSGGFVSSGSSGAYGINNNGQILGTKTTSNGYNTQPTTQQTTQQTSGSSGPSPEDLLRGQISGGWDSYISSLDQQLGLLPGQKSNLETQTQGQYTGGLADITGQQNLGLQDINSLRGKAERNQVKSLKDVGSNIGNLMNTGQVMLGTRGAADSSAANMYSYALTKLGSKARGDVMGQTKEIMTNLNDREARLNEITNQETNKLNTWKDSQLTSIAQWFNDAQNSLLQQKGQAGLNKSQDLANLSKQLLDRATQYAMSVKNQYDQLQGGLVSWAANHSNDINSLKSNIQAVSQVPIPQVQAPQVAGMPNFQGNNFSLPAVGYGGGSTTKYDIFGNPIQG